MTDGQVTVGIDIGSHMHRVAIGTPEKKIAEVNLRGVRPTQLTKRAFRGDFPDGFDFNKHVRLELSDATPSGSLLGIRFERP
jgi:hypothetical protein